MALRKRIILIASEIAALLLLPLVVFAVNVTVPSAPGAGYWLQSTSTGAWTYVASSTADWGGTWQGKTPATYVSTTTAASTYISTSTASTTYTPYTGANANLNLGSHSVSAATGTFSSAVSSSQVCLGGVCNTSWPSSASAAGTSTDVQIASGTGLGADTGVFQENPKTHQLTLSAPTSSEIIGSSTSWNSLIINLTAVSSVTAFTIPSNVYSITITLTSAGGGASGLGFVVGGGANYSWFSVSSSVPTATSTDIFLCGGGGGAGVGGGNGGNGQGVGGSPGTYGGPGGIAPGGSGVAGGDASCFASSTPTGVTSSTGNTAGSGSGYTSGGNGWKITGTLTVIPGATYYYYLGAPGGGAGGNNGLPASLSITATQSLTTLSPFALAFSGTIITGGATPLATTAGNGFVVITGNDIAGQVVNASSTPNIIITFATSTPNGNPAYYDNPWCIAGVATSSKAYTIEAFSTTSTLTLQAFNNGSAINIPTSTQINYFCLGEVNF